VIVMTATVTAAVAPFIQTIATKVAEGSYAAARGLVRGLVRKHGKRKREPPGTTGPVLLVHDRHSGVVLRLRPDLPDDALEALTALDLSRELAIPYGRGWLRVAWNERAGRWDVVAADRP
jgi:hypothetical protein